MTATTPRPAAAADDSHPAILDWFRRRGFNDRAVRALARLRASDLHALADATTHYALSMYRDGLRDSRQLRRA